MFVTIESQIHVKIWSSPEKVMGYLYAKYQTDCERASTFVEWLRGESLEFVFACVDPEVTDSHQGCMNCCMWQDIEDLIALADEMGLQ